MCNCGKNRPPAGVAKPAEAPAPPPKEEKAPAASGATQTFALQRRDGSVAAFGSRLEAAAAQVRTGGQLLSR